MRPDLTRLKGICKRRKRNSSLTKQSSRERGLGRLAHSLRPGVCPACRLPYDRTGRRRLVDSCGHAACYACLGAGGACGQCSDSHPVCPDRPGSETNTQKQSTPVASLERASRAGKRTRLAGSEQELALPGSPAGTLPRKRKEVTRRNSNLATRRDSELGLSSRDSPAPSHAPSHAPSSASSQWRLSRLVTGQTRLPKPLYFEVPGPERSVLAGRAWLWAELRAGLPRAPGLIITGGPGTGKTAAILALVERSCFGPRHATEAAAADQGEEDLGFLANQVVAYHFCQADNAPTCLVPEFVHSLAAQLAQAPQLQPYYQLLQAEPALQAALSLSSCTRDPGTALLTGVLDPLARLTSSGALTLPPPGWALLVVDALCEAEQHRPDYGHTLASFLSEHQARLPAWLRLVVTARTGPPDLAGLLMLGLDQAVEGRVAGDLTAYCSQRVSRAGLATRLPRAGRGSRHLSTKLASWLAARAAGCFLYAKLSLDLVERGTLVIKAGSFKVLPQSLAEIFLLTLNSRFSSTESWQPVADILAVALASLQPVSPGRLYSLVCAGEVRPGLGWPEFKAQVRQLGELLVARADGSLMCFHPTLRDWLVRRREGEPSKFQVDPRPGHAMIALSAARQPELQSAERVLELAHHTLKSNLHRSAAFSLQPRQIQAHFAGLACSQLSMALACPRAVYSPILKVARLLLLAGADPDQEVEGGTRLVAQHARLGHTDMVSLLLEFGADPASPDQQGEDPLTAAAGAGQLSAVQLLLQCGAGLGSSSLTAAARAGHNTVVELLLDQDWPGGEEEKEEAARVALAAAVAAGNTQVTDLLSDRPGVIEEATTSTPAPGLTPLTSAIIAGQTSTVLALINTGASTNALDCFDRSPLDVAIYQGSAEMVELLLEGGANMEQEDGRGIRPLDRVIQHGNAEVVSIFLRRGAKLGPATWAVAESNPEIKLLLLTKLLEDGTTLYRAGRLAEAAHRFRYAVRRLAQSSLAGRREFQQLQAALLLGLARCDRRLGRPASTVDLATQAKVVNNTVELEDKIGTEEAGKPEVISNTAILWEEDGMEVEE